MKKVTTSTFWISEIRWNSRFGNIFSPLCLQFLFDYYWLMVSIYTFVQEQYLYEIWIGGKFWLNFNLVNDFSLRN